MPRCAAFAACLQAGPGIEAEKDQATPFKIITTLNRFHSCIGKFNIGVSWQVGIINRVRDLSRSALLSIIIQEQQVGPG